MFRVAKDMMRTSDSRFEEPRLLRQPDDLGEPYVRRIPPHLLVQLQGATHGPAFLYGTSFGTSTQPDHAIVDAFSLCQIELFWKSQPASLGSRLCLGSEQMFV